MTPAPQSEFPPAAAETIRVLFPVVEECGTRYRVESGSFSSDSTDFAQIIDKNGKPLRGVWDERWTTIAPGIETRKPSETGRRDDAYSADQELRIHPGACPVYVLFRRTSSLMHYDEGGDFYSRDEWRRYEKVRILQWIEGFGRLIKRLIR